MTGGALLLRDPQPGPAAETGGCATLPASLARRLDAAAGAWEQAAPHTLVSLSLVVAGPAIDRLPANLAAFSFWSRPQSGELLLGSGDALVVEEAGAGRLEALARRFDALRAGWRHLDADSAGAVPAAFVRLAFAAEGRAELRVPRLLVRPHAQGNLLTFSAGKRRESFADLRAAWLAEARRVLAAAARPAPVAGRPNRLARVGEAPDREAWLARVAAALGAIGEGRLEKVVLTRRLRVRGERPFDAARIAAVLGARHPGCAILAFAERDGAVMVAATPERLAELRAGRITSDALAGTCPRDADAGRDAALGRALLASAKDLHEHRLVVDWIVSGLSQVCDAVEHSDRPRLMLLPRLQHLWTPVSGRTRPGRGLLDAVARLHPTPAVAGLPTPQALAWLAESGDRRDGWYTGAAGWVDLRGDGEFRVILRSATIDGDGADLYAGAGIVAQSRPEAEFTETELKLRTMLEALGDA